MCDSLPSCIQRDIRGRSELLIIGEQLAGGQSDGGTSEKDALERLKVLINSSTPIIVMETVEEVRAVRMVRAACSDLNLATFEWTIASGLARSGSTSHEPQIEDALPAGGYNLHHSETEQNSKAIYNSQDPTQMLS